MEITNRCPPILYVQGWRFYFYSNEGNEPMHVHAVKGDAECKYRLHPGRFDITEEFEYNCTPRLRREVRQIIFEHFDQIVCCLAGTLRRASCRVEQIRSRNGAGRNSRLPGMASTGR